MKKLAIMLFVFFGLGCKSILSMKANERFFDEKDLAELQARLDLLKSGNANEQWITMPCGYDTCLTHVAPLPLLQILGSLDLLDLPLIAASGAPSQEEIAARNKRDAELNTCRQSLQSTLPALAAAASSSQATAHSPQMVKASPSVGAKRPALTYPEKEPAAKKQKYPKKILPKCDPKAIAIPLKTFPCSIKACKDMFNDQSCRNAHVLNSHADKAKKHVCPILGCAVGFNMKPRMKEHMDNHAKAKKH